MGVNTKENRLTYDENGNYLCVPVSPSFSVSLSPCLLLLCGRTIVWKKAVTQESKERQQKHTHTISHP